MISKQIAKILKDNELTPLSVWKGEENSFELATDDEKNKFLNVAKENWKASKTVFGTWILSDIKIKSPT